MRFYGGPTETCELLPGSPAIDAGDNALVPSGVATDQRGFSRIVNGTVDIGAFEVQLYLVYTTADHGPGSLRNAITNANQAAGSTILFATSGVITLASALPAITSDVYMDGPGANVLTRVRVEMEPTASSTSRAARSPSPGLTIDDGSSGSSGGGIENDGALALTNCAVTNNSAASNGGGIDNQGTLTLTDSTVAGNSATNSGGGIENDGTLLLVNSTIANDSAQIGGGINNAGAMSSINSTVADNSAASSGGGVDSSGTTSIANTIIAYNTLTVGGSSSDFSGTVTTDPGNNLIGDSSGSSGFTQSSDLLNVDPLLSSLGYYGGPTETLALLPGSPAIDAGSNALASVSGNALTTDQRGLPRIVNGTVDMGAFECSGFTITVLSGNDQQANVNAPFPSFLVVLVTSKHGDPVSGGVVTFAAPGTGASATFPAGINRVPTNVSGVAGVGLIANTTAGSYTVGAAASGGSSTSFNLTNLAGAATKLAFAQQPTGTAYGDIISPVVTVDVVDQYNNLVTSTASITIAFGTNPTSASLGGTLMVNAVGGVATFSDLTVSEVGTAYTLVATSPSLGAAPASNSFNITPRSITVTAAPNTKGYDGTTTASAIPTITSGSLVNGDTANFTEVYSTRNAGTTLTLTPSGTVNDGNDGNNYTYTFVPASTGVITTEALTITGVANTKTYDGTTSAAGVPTITSGSLQGSDTANFSEMYNTKKRGHSGLTLTPSGTVNDGNGGNNYTYTFTPVSTGVITAEALTITGVANTKVYNATTSAAGLPMITSGSLGTGDTADFTEIYNSVNVGTGLTLTPSGTANDGNGGDNYTYTFVPVSTGVINKATLTITAVTNSKVYDGTNSATGVPTVSGVQGSDTVTNLSETYVTKNAGTGKTLSVAEHDRRSTTWQPKGTNYTVTFVNNATGVITARALTVTAVTDTKTYDGTAGSTATPTISSGVVQTGDTANFSEAFNNKNAGIGKTLTPSGTVTDGNSGLNYTYIFVSNTTGVIKATEATHGNGRDQHESLRRHDQQRAATPTITSKSAMAVRRHRQLHRDLRHQERRHRQNAHPGRVGHRRQQRQQLYVHLRHQHHRCDQHPGAHGHGGDNHQTLPRRHDVQGGRRPRSRREVCRGAIRPTSSRPMTPGTSAPARRSLRADR